MTRQKIYTPPSLRAINKNSGDRGSMHFSAFLTVTRVASFPKAQRQWKNVYKHVAGASFIVFWWRTLVYRGQTTSCTKIWILTEHTKYFYPWQMYNSCLTFCTYKKKHLFKDLYITISIVPSHFCQKLIKKAFVQILRAVWKPDIE